jgi:hypothetical protein
MRCIIVYEVGLCKPCLNDPATFNSEPRGRQAVNLTAAFLRQCFFEETVGVVMEPRICSRAAPAAPVSAKTVHQGATRIDCDPASGFFVLRLFHPA